MCTYTRLYGPGSFLAAQRPFNELAGKASRFGQQPPSTDPKRGRRLDSSRGTTGGRFSSSLASQPRPDSHNPRASTHTPRQAHKQPGPSWDSGGAVVSDFAPTRFGAVFKCSPRASKHPIPRWDRRRAAPNCRVTAVSGTYVATESHARGQSIDRGLDWIGCVRRVGICVGRSIHPSSPSLKSTLLTRDSTPPYIYPPTHSAPPTYHNTPHRITLPALTAAAAAALAAETWRPPPHP